MSTYCAGARTFAVLIILLLYGSFVHAQDSKSKSLETNSTDPDSIKRDASDLAADLFDNDSLNILFSTFSRPFEVQPFTDSLLSYARRIYDPARQLQPPYFHLGNLLSPMVPSYYVPEEASTFEVAEKIRGPLNFSPENFIFYNSPKPFFNLQYALMANARDDNRFSGDMGLNFAKNTNVSLHYKRYNQAGFLVNDRTRTTKFSTGLRQSRWKNRWLMQILYTYNQYYRQETGGVIEDSTLIKNGFSGNSLSVPVFTPYAGSKMSDWTILMNNEIALRKDTLPATKLWRSNTGMRLGWTIRYRDNSELYYDQHANDDATDTSYYRALNFDSRGLRNSLTYSLFSNEAYLAVGGNSGDIPAKKDYLRAGIRWEKYQINYQPTDTAFSVLLLVGQGVWSINKHLSLEAKGDYQLSSLTSAFHLNGKLQSGIGNWARLDAWLQLRNQYPGYSYERLNLNGVNIQTNKLRNEFETHFGGTLTLPFLNLDITFTQSIIRNLTFFNNDWQVIQSHNTAIISGLRAGYKLKISAFHFDNYLQAQKANLSEIRIPPLLTRHSLYYSGRVFHGHALISTGFDLHYVAPFRTYGYSPLLRQFYVPDNGIQHYTFDYDFFLSFKIRLLRGFVRVDNLSYLYAKKVDYQIYSYPQDQLGIHIGFDWLFNN